MNKVATESVEMLADIAIIDPALTVSVPPMVTAATGVDAMAHCVEAFTSKRSHPIIDAYALQGIELVGRYLGRAVRDGSDIEARAGLALAAFYGGVCLGPVNTTAGHAIAYPLGTRHKLAHGIANALIFPHVLAVNAPAVPEKTALVGRALGFGAEGRQQVLGGARDFCAEPRPRHGAQRTRRAARRPPRLGEGGARDPAAARLEPRRPLRGRHPRNLRSGLLRPRRMTPMTKEAFVALVTCFNDDETVNYAATRAQVRRQVAAGNNIMCAGTNGDFTALTFDEKVRLCGEVVDEVGGKARVIVNAGMPATFETILLAKEFEAIGVDGIAVITPFFIACTQDGLIRHFTSVADAVTTPVYLYDIPARTQNHIEPETAKALAAHGNIAGIKDSGGAQETLEQYLQVGREVPGFEVYSGPDHLVHWAFRNGAKGCISGLGNVMPETLAAIVTAFNAGDEARRG